MVPAAYWLLDFLDPSRVLGRVDFLEVKQVTAG